jgi:hypothetical protein
MSYHLRPPTVPDIVREVEQVLGTSAPIVPLLDQAGLNGTETDDESTGRLIDLMRDGTPILRVCGRSAQIRRNVCLSLTAHPGPS